MRYGSICSGVEAASLAWEPLGWTPAWFAEVDPFCRKLLAHRWPRVPNLGDITGADFVERVAALGPVDLLVGGTPCQSFSHAGKRAGLADPRGNLTLRYLDLVGQIRPAWVVWENVPGVLSDDGGRTFGTVLGRLADLGYRLAYRVLDAALAGVPQRRRRVFVVGHLGAVCPGAVLSLAEGEGRDLEPGGEAKAEAAADAGGGPAAVRSSVYVNNGTDNWRGQPVSGTVVARGGKDGYTTGLLIEPVTTLGTVTHALTCEGGDASEDGTGRGTPVVAYPIDMRQASRGERLTNNRREGSSGGAPGTGVGEAGDPAPTLANSHTPVVAVCLGSDPITTTDIAQPLTTRHGDPGVVAYQCHGTNVGPMGTLKAGNSSLTGGVPFVVQETPPVAYTIHGTPASEVASQTETAAALRARTPGQSENSTTTVVVEAVAFTERGRAGGQQVECQPNLAYCLTNPGAGGRSDERNVALAVVETQPPGVVMAFDSKKDGCDAGEITPTLRSMNFDGSWANGGGQVGGVIGMPPGVRYVVRRLMPVECERLQGMPDNHTLIPVKRAGKKLRKDREYAEIDGEVWELAADGPRYRAIGNSMAVPVMRQIGERIDNLVREG